MEGCAWRKEGTDKKRIRWKSFDNHLIHQSGRRDSNPRPSAWKANALSTELLPQSQWARMDSNHRRHKPADLQSAPFGHSGTCPLHCCNVCFKKKSGRRDSNPRPSAWKANALSTELLPQSSGQRWIRTTEGVSQQIYSLPHLATLVFALLQLRRAFQQCLSQLRCKGTIFILTCK